MYAGPVRLINLEMWWNPVFGMLSSMRSWMKSRTGKRREAHCFKATICLLEGCHPPWPRTHRGVERPKGPANFWRHSNTQASY